MHELNYSGKVYVPGVRDNQGFRRAYKEEVPKGFGDVLGSSMGNLRGRKMVSGSLRCASEGILGAP